MIILKFLKNTFRLGYFLALLLLTACGGNEIKQLDQIALQDEVGIERATNIELLYSDSAVVRVAIHAPTLLRYIHRENPKQIFPDGVDADFYDEEHFQTSKLVANYAEQFQRERKVYLRDSVVVWNIKNEMLETDELIWDESIGQIYSNEKVKITTPSQVIEGIGFKSNLDFSVWEIYQVSGIIESKNVVENPF